MHAPCTLRCWRRACLALWLSLVVPRGVAAYVLPAEALCRFLGEARRGTGYRDVTLQLSTELDNHERPIDERLYLKRPERLRLLQQDEPPVLTVQRDGMQRVFVDNTAPGAAQPSNDLLPVLFFPQGSTVDDMGARICRALQAAGVQTSTVSLGRLGDKIAFVIGAHSWESQLPQLWLNRSDFQPLRLLLPQPSAAVNKASDSNATTGSTSMLELQLLDYGSGPAGAALPHIFAWYQDGKLVRKAEVIGARFNSNLSEALFDLNPRRR